VIRMEAIRINQDYCGKCSFCYSVCPFEAISSGEEIKLDIDKCRVCGICYSTCPSNAIETAYYTTDWMIDAVRPSVKEGIKTAVIACRGSTLSKNEFDSVAGKKFAMLKLPCVGRVELDFFPRAAELGIDRIIIAPCEDDFCRFEVGAKIAAARAEWARALLKDTGQHQEIILLRKAIRAEVDRNKCISCGTCIAVCPYEAVNLETPGIARIDTQKCMGCGSCVAECPALAIEMRMNRWEAGKPTLLIECQWCEYDTEMPKEVQVVELPCSGAIDTLQVLKSLRSGTSRVLVAACKQEECKLEEGSKRAEKRISSLVEQLKKVGMGDAVRVVYTSPKEPILRMEVKA